MCGIAGLIQPVTRSVGDDLSLTHEPSINAMVRALHHRGPDGEGAWRSPVGNHEVIFGHTRLAILDLSDVARQPMIDPRSGCVLVYNGELYNFLELRNELLQLGEPPFTSTGDTEVLLRSYLHWGPSFVTKLRGMFAFGLYDPRDRRLLLGRDSLGIKPLYLTEDLHGRLAFASEVRALLELTWVRRVLDPLGLVSYLAYGSVQDPYTLVRGIRAVPAGHTVEIDLSGEQFVVHEPCAYWTLPAIRPELAQVPQAEITQQVRAALVESVRLHMVSDVPLGAFLSGGIDSSSIVALMAEVSPSHVHTLTVSFDEEQYDESAIALQVARRYGTHHTNVRLTAGDFLQDLSCWLESQDQPSSDGANTWIVSRVCKQAGLTVALSGLGGDELFAGYYTFRMVARARRLFKVIAWLPASLRSALASAIRQARDDSSAALKLSEWLASDNTNLSAYLTIRRMFMPPALNGLLDPLIVSLIPEFALSTEHLRTLKQLSNIPDTTAAVSLLEASTYLVNTLLRDSDQMGMAHSLEIRVPFVDRAVVELVCALPGKTRLAGAGPKPLLTAAMRDKLDRQSTDRPKWTFSFPFDQWLCGPLRLVVEEQLREMSGFPFQSEAVQDLWQQFLDGRRGVNSARILTLFSLAAWMSRHHVEGGL